MITPSIFENNLRIISKPRKLRILSFSEKLGFLTIKCMCGDNRRGETVSEFSTLYLSDGR